MDPKDDDRRKKIASIARVTGADRRTVAKAIEGKYVRGAAGVALEAEMKRRGLR